MFRSIMFRRNSGVSWKVLGPFFFTSSVIHESQLFIIYVFTPFHPKSVTSND